MALVLTASRSILIFPKKTDGTPSFHQLNVNTHLLCIARVYYAVMVEGSVAAASREGSGGGEECANRRRSGTKKGVGGGQV